MAVTEQEAPTGATRLEFATEPREGAIYAPQRGPLASTRESREEALAACEDRVYERNLRIVESMTHFAEVDPARVNGEGEVISPGTTEPPEAWVRELGPEGAAERLRIAKLAYISTKDAPVGMTAAKSIVSGLAKARAVREAGRGNLQLNVMAVFPTQQVVYEELVVRDD